MPNGVGIPPSFPPHPATDRGNQVGSSEGAQAVARLQSETGNLTVMLTRAANAHRTKELADALWGLTEYWKLTGLVQPELAHTAHDAIIAHGTARDQARIGFALADLTLARSDLDGARAQFERALVLHQA